MGLGQKGEATQTIPLGTVLTLPATGSEMNNGAVISCRETKEKYPFYANFPVFSILDPEVTFSLPDHQIACGIADTFVHVLEQYLTKAGESRLMDRWAESILQTLVEIAPKIKENKQDYQLMADFMMSATMALNGFIALGVTEDWSTHMIGHELTALTGLTHGHTLAIVMPGTMQVLRKEKGEKSCSSVHAYSAWFRVRMTSVLTKPSEKRRLFPLLRFDYPLKRRAYRCRGYR